jgi:hypothetical protein
MTQEEFDKIVDGIIGYDMERFGGDSYLEFLKNEIIDYCKIRDYHLLRIRLLQAYDVFDKPTKLLNNVKNVLNKKAHEYAAEKSSNPDRLHNFKMANKLFRISEKQFAYNLMLKHIISIIDIIDGYVDADMNMINEKFQDAYNYCLLIEAIKKESSNVS